MSVQDLTDYEYAHKRLSYDPETGIFIWKEAGPEFFMTQRAFKTWNTRFSGSVAGTIDSSGHMQIKIFNKAILAHRLAWFMQHGEWPKASIDHVNGCKTDNRISNLRVVEHKDNMKNLPKRKDNKTGYTGVFWNKKYGSYQAYIRYNGKLIHLGYHKNIEDAILVRREAERDYGYHENHGR